MGWLVKIRTVIVAAGFSCPDRCMGKRFEAELTAALNAFHAPLSKAASAYPLDLSLALLIPGGVLPVEPACPRGHSLTARPPQVRHLSQ